MLTAVAFLGLLIPPSLAQADSVPTIRVRLFAAMRSRKMSLQSEQAFRIGDRDVQGPLSVLVKDKRIWIKNGKNFSTAGPRLRVQSATLEDWMEIQPKGGPSKRTVGVLQFAAKGATIQVINEIDLESYVTGIVGPELGAPDLNPEGLKAQIVASRSYVLAMRGRHARSGYDFCDTPHCQVFGSLGAIPESFHLAATRTQGEYLSYQDRPIPAFYHDNCGGSTSAVQDVWEVPSVPYLRRVRDGDQKAYCRFAPKARWKFVVDRKTLKKCFVRKKWVNRQEALDSLRVVRADKAGRVQQILIQSHKPLWVSVQKLRHALNQYYGSEVLLSSRFRIIRKGNRYVFVGRGWGHGVGLCQWGTMQMAKEGKSYRTILQHYFPGTRIDCLPEVLYAKTDKTPSAPPMTFQNAGISDPPVVLATEIRPPQAPSTLLSDLFLN